METTALQATKYKELHNIWTIKCINSNCKNLKFPHKYIWGIRRCPDTHDTHNESAYVLVGSTDLETIDIESCWVVPYVDLHPGFQTAPPRQSSQWSIVSVSRVQQLM